MPLEPWTDGEQPDGGFKLKTSRSRRQGVLLYWGGIATLFAILVSSTPWINAQIATTTATLSGAVTDPMGALLPKASVTLTSTEAGINRTFVTDAGGRYLFSQLPPAAYSITVKAKGFKVYQQNGIVLKAALSATQDVTLTVGSEAQSITVTEDASQLNTNNSNVAADVSAQQIVELPLNVRNVYGLATLNSALGKTSESQQLMGGGNNTNDDADQDISFMNFAGGFFGTSAFLLDGAWDTDPEWGAVINVPSVDATQEMKIQNSSFTAQYGWSTGNVINVVTKSGSNAFHGSAYEFYANEKLDALNYFSNANNPFSRNQTGASAGGPLYIPGLYKQREKTFIFGLYERVAITSPSTTQYTVPDSKFLGGDFSELLGSTSQGNDALGRPIYKGQIYDPRSGHQIISGQPDIYNAATNPHGTGLTATQTGWIRNPIQGNKLSNLVGYTPDTVGAKLLSYYPKAQVDQAIPYNLTVSGSSPAHSDEYNVRVDHNVNDNVRAYFRYSYKKETKTGAADDWGSDPAGPGNMRPNNRWGMWAGISEVFSPTFTMNITSGVTAWHETSDNQSFGFDPSGQLGLPAYVSANDPLFPTINVGGGMSPLGPGGNDQQAVTNHGPIGTVSADFIKLKGKQTLNFGFMGVEQVDSQHNYFQDQLTFNGGFTTGPDPNNPVSFATGSGVAEMLLGTLDSGAIGTPYNPLVSNHLLGWYVQDDWKPTSRLTLNLGVRYEVQTPDTYRHNVASTFDPNATNPLSSLVGLPLKGALQFLGTGNRYVYNPNYDNWAPRMGFSYQVVPKAVIHGGYGIFYPQAVTCCWPGDSDGFAATTNVNASQDGGILQNPHISTSNPWGGQYAQITGNANGQFQQVGNGIGSVFKSRPSPYVEQWLLGVQYAITANDQIDVNYIGNRGIRMVGSLNYNQLNPSYLATMSAAQLKASPATNPFAAPLTQLEASGTIAASGCNLDNANVQTAQLLSPYPQFCNGGVSQTDAPVGQSLYNSLQVTYNHRVSKGLTALVSYTYSKFLDNTEGNNSWSYAGNTGPANNYNMAAEKSVDAGDVPQALVASYVYQLPIGRGKPFGSDLNRIVDAVVGGWELSGIATFKEGIPINVSGSNQPTFGGSPRPNVTGNPQGPKTLHEWFNTGAFSYAPYGSFGNAPRFFSNVRGPRYQDWDTVLEKNWRFKTNMRAQFRLETFNTFNHPSFYTPNGGYGGCDPNAGGGCQSGIGQITHAFAPRIVQWAGKFYW